LWPDAQGHYTFQQIALLDLGSQYRLASQSATIYYENGLSDSSFEGAVAEPRLTNAGGACIPEDIASSLAVNVYAQFERLHRFELELGSASQLSWPRKVGVEIHLSGSPTDIANNAHYFGDQDVITIMPYTLNEVPVALNQGIIAHEHFHAHFQSQVMAHLDLGVPLDLSESDLGTNSGVNNFVLRGWNEGLADFFAAVYTGRPDSFDASVKAPARNLTGSLSPMMLGMDFANLARGATSHPEMDRMLLLTRTSYGEGSLLAKLLYRLAFSGGLPPKVFLAHVMASLDKIPSLVSPIYGLEVMDFETIVPLLLRDFPVNDTACANLAMVLSKGLMQREFTQCRN
jgi:hypothetical protein